MQIDGSRGHCVIDVRAQASGASIGTPSVRVCDGDALPWPCWPYLKDGRTDQDERVSYEQAEDLRALVAWPSGHLRRVWSAVPAPGHAYGP